MVLPACGHIIPRIRSIYRWANAIHDEGECRVAWHTRLNLVPMITDRANREHPYDVPCVIALPILGGGPSYIAWILSETNRSQR